MVACKETFIIFFGIASEKKEAIKDFDDIAIVGILLANLMIFIEAVCSFISSS